MAQLHWPVLEGDLGTAKWEPSHQRPSRWGRGAVCAASWTWSERSAGVARVAKGRMPQAPVPAALHSLESAGKSMDDVAAITTHNPFAVNDLWFAHETGVKLADMNAYG